MYDVTKITVQQLDNLINQELEELRHYSLVQLHKRLRANGVVFSGELLDSLESQIVSQSKELYAVFVVNFRGYGRLQDLKYMEYSPLQKVNNKGKRYEKDRIEELPKAVREIAEYYKDSVDKFAFVPGYYGRFRPDNSRAIARIAWGILWNRSMMNKIVLRGRGWYSKGRSAFVKEFRKKITERIAVTIAENIALGLGDKVGK